MDSKAKTSEKKTAVRSYADEKARASLLVSAARSGAAEKVSTVKNGGTYSIRIDDNEGTSVFTRAVFSLAAKKGERKISAERFAEAEKAYRGDAEKVKATRFPKEYGNLKRVASLIRSRIADGTILAFALPEGADEKALAVFSK